VVAATMLLKIASDVNGGDLVRKACVDLLTINAGPHAARSPARKSQREDAPESPMTGAAPPSEETILRALQTLGEQRLL
jgi:hypothetical protein